MYRLMAVGLVMLAASGPAAAMGAEKQGTWSMRA